MEHHEMHLSPTARASSSKGRWTALGGGEQLEVVQHLMAGAEILPAQQPSPSDWSPEKRLAAAVLASALIEIRDYHTTKSHRHQVTEVLAWMNARKSSWPFSFVRLCELFALDPDWVRESVERWMGTRDSQAGSSPAYRRAA